MLVDFVIFDIVFVNGQIDFNNLDYNWPNFNVKIDIMICHEKLTLFESIDILNVQIWFSSVNVSVLTFQSDRCQKF